MRPTAKATFQDVISKFDWVNNNTFEVAIQNSTNRLLCYLPASASSETEIMSSSWAVPFSSWRHYCLVFNGDLVGNSSWRLDLWSEVLRDVNLNGPVLGRGYGVSLGDLYGFEGADQTELRSAHNSHMTIFARSGYLGVALWFWMWLIWFIAMIRARRALAARGSRNEAAITVVTMAFAVAVLVNAIFDPSIESPTVSAWIWSAFGLGMGLMLLSRPSPDWEPAPVAATARG